LIPTDGIVKSTADKITASTDSDLAKARAIYEWIVDNTSGIRKPRVAVSATFKRCSSRATWRKCADINALYVGLARATGLPARDLYGIRVGPSDFGYKSLGANTPDVTHAQHCRAECS